MAKKSKKEKQAKKAKKQKQKQKQKQQSRAKAARRSAPTKKPVAKKEAAPKQKPAAKKKAASKQKPGAKKKTAPNKKAAAKAERPVSKKPAAKSAGSKRRSVSPARAKASAAPTKSGTAKPPARAGPAVAKKPVRWETRPKHRVEEDEPRERDGAEERAFVSSATGVKDDLAEELGEAFVQSATSGEEAGLEMANAETEEERGGPFVETTAEVEFADDVDASNPEDAEPAALPTTSAAADDDEEE
jgi:hypothetical protein